jgi:hypothetical protein
LLSNGCISNFIFSWNSGRSPQGIHTILCTTENFGRWVSKNARRWNTEIWKFVSQILQYAVTFFGETLYYRYSCIRNVFLTHSFNWLHVCDKVYFVYQVSAVNRHDIQETFSVSISLILQLILFVCKHLANGTLETSIDRNGNSGCGNDENANRKSIVTKLFTVMWVKVKGNERDLTK